MHQSVSRPHVYLEGRSRLASTFSAARRRNGQVEHFLVNEQQTLVAQEYPTDKPWAIPYEHNFRTFSLTGDLMRSKCLPSCFPFNRTVGNAAPVSMHSKYSSFI